MAGLSGMTAFFMLYAKVILKRLNACLHDKSVISAKNEFGFNALIIAIAHGKKAIVQALLEDGGIDVNEACGKFAHTALYFAVITGQTDTVNLLLSPRRCSCRMLME